MTTRIDAAHRTDASVKRLRLPLTRIGRKQQGLKQTTHRLGARCGSPPALAGRPWFRWLCSTDFGCMKFCGSPHATVGLRFFTNDRLSSDINELAFADLSFANCLMQLFGSRI